jgi:hypothetical protein
MQATYQRQNSSRFRWFIFLLILAGILYMSVSYISTENISFINYNNHAVESHGNEALEVRNCLDKFGGIRMFYNPQTNRFAEICFMENGKFGIQITEEENEVTSFIKNKMRTLKQVVHYLKNSGYVNRIY